MIPNVGVLFFARSVECVSFSKLSLASLHGIDVWTRLFCSEFINGRAFSVTAYSFMLFRIGGSGL